ncbi:MAG: hypothetical protein CBB68_02320 [Rhodospirillaceae bacterium TMED8]|nr:glutamate synthase [Magnetovibrio sp.]OUT52210.1 MAG: hypothetical protein CBB68_02320 [Rhodospirillaceae bacterium TMED8]
MRAICSKSGPYVVKVKAGQKYLWCSCGRSQSQPWCDQSHSATDDKPLEFIAPITAEFYMCGCKQSENKPYCFGNCRGHHRN